MGWGRSEWAGGCGLRRGGKGGGGQGEGVPPWIIVPVQQTCTFTKDCCIRTRRRQTDARCAVCSCPPKPCPRARVLAAVQGPINAICHPVDRPPTLPVRGPGSTGSRPRPHERICRAHLPVGRALHLWQPILACSNPCNDHTAANDILPRQNRRATEIRKCPLSVFAFRQP